MEPNNGVNRRSVLKSITSVSAGISLLSGPVLGDPAKKRDLDKIYRQALHVREQTGSQEKFIRYLENHGLQVTQTTKSGGLSRGGVSTQKLDKSSIETYLAVTHKMCGEDAAYIDLRAEIDPNSVIFESGEGGPDTLTLSWNSDHYEVEHNSWYSNGNNVKFKDFERNGVRWDYKDGAACTTGSCDHTISMGCKAEILDTSDPRAIIAKYYHTWSEAKATGFSVSAKGEPSLGITKVSKSSLHSHNMAEEDEGDIIHDHNCW